MDENLDEVTRFSDGLSERERCPVGPTQWGSGEPHTEEGGVLPPSWGPLLLSGAGCFHACRPHPGACQPLSPTLPPAAWSRAGCLGDTPQGWAGPSRTGGLHGFSALRMPPWSSQWSLDRGLLVRGAHCGAAWRLPAHWGAHGASRTGETRFPPTQPTVCQSSLVWGFLKSRSSLDLGYKPAQAPRRVLPCWGLQRCLRLAERAGDNGRREEGDCGPG